MNDPPPLGLASKLALGLEILGVYVRVRWWLGRMDIGDLARRLRETGPEAARPTGLPDVLTGTRLAHAVVRTLRLLPTDSRCLTQSLVLLGLLARRGVDASVVIGVRTTPEFAAHAWVQAGTLALLPSHAPAFEPLAEI